MTHLFASSRAPITAGCLFLAMLVAAPVTAADIEEQRELFNQVFATVERATGVLLITYPRPTVYCCSNTSFGPTCEQPGYASTSRKPRQRTLTPSCMNMARCGQLANYAIATR
ncbi:MAG: hypothetical protein IID57_02665 [Proteobacteria bacterium]|nr:hypothetical protein [Pseudomonadota bacterium]